MYVPFTEGDRHLSIVTSKNIVDDTNEMTSTIHPVLDDYNSEILSENYTLFMIIIL